MELTHCSLPPELADTLGAVLARLIPTDDVGPGAVEAGVLQFLDSELSGALRGRRPLYAAALADLDRLADTLHGSRFAELPDNVQDDVLRAVESRSEGTEALQGWFPVVLDDCLDGFLSDPVHGGNRDSVGWKLVGYPGPSLTWSADEQELDRRVPFRSSSVVTLSISRRKSHV
jgi:gluconate 2-dehydrogenase gamma chain